MVTSFAVRQDAARVGDHPGVVVLRTRVEGPSMTGEFAAFHRELEFWTATIAELRTEGSTRISSQEAAPARRGSDCRRGR